MAAPKAWCPDRRDMIWIDCNPQAGRAAYDETNPFAVKFKGPRGVASYILGHQPKSFDWRARNAKPHRLRKVPLDSYTRACETLNQIIELGE
jgi:mRNA interferase MazF